MGLYDRDYMHEDQDSSFASNGNNMLLALIVANVLVYVMGFGVTLKSFDVTVKGLFGSIFSHASFGHLFFNMFSLFVFGNLIARRCGFWKFLGLYLISGIIGNLLFIAFFNGNMYQLLGASGAVYGIMMATAMLEPDKRFFIIFLPFVPLKTKTLVIVFTIIEVLSQISGRDSGTAHLAHLGGYIGGYIFTLIFLRRYILWNPLRWKKSPHIRKAPNVTFKVYTPDTADSDSPVTQKELDYLLDKISEQGINSLTPDEFARLKKAREQIQGR